MIEFLFVKIFLYIFFLFFSVALRPNMGHGLLILEFLDHTQRRTTVGRTPLDEWSARRRDLYLTTHNTHNRQNIQAPGRIRTHDLSRRAAADLRLRPRGHWDRLIDRITLSKINFSNWRSYPVIVMAPKCRFLRGISLTDSTEVFCRLTENSTAGGITAAYAATTSSALRPAVRR